MVSFLILSTVISTMYSSTCTIQHQTYFLEVAMCQCMSGNLKYLTTTGDLKPHLSKRKHKLAILKLCKLYIYSVNSQNDARKSERVYCRSIPFR